MRRYLSISLSKRNTWHVINWFLLAKSHNEYKHIFHTIVYITATTIQHAQEFNTFQVFGVFFVQIFHRFHRIQIILECLPGCLYHGCDMILEGIDEADQFMADLLGVTELWGLLNFAG